MSNDITQHNDSELTDIFLNDEYLYGLARSAGSIDDLKEAAKDFFVFSDDQMSTFEQDFFDGVFDE